MFKKSVLIITACKPCPRLKSNKRCITDSRPNKKIVHILKFYLYTFTAFADVSFNTSIIKEAIDSALEKNVKLLVTPELSVTGYTCADLFFARTLLIESERAVAELADYIKGKDIVLLVCAPVPFFNKLYNLQGAFWAQYL